MKSGNKVGTCGRAIFLLLASVALAPVTMSQVSEGSATARTEPPPPSAYAGNAACALCHRQESEFYGLTAHARDSAQATAKHILGSFRPGHNVFQTSNPNLIVKMVAAPDGFYQDAVNLADPGNHLKEKFGITIGSGRHGQTYLYWDEDELYELPVSYWTWDHQWVLSPGFPAGQIHFDREVVPRCLECHASYFQWLNPPPNRFAKDSLVLGIDCERCHGPGALHVARERSATPPPRGSRLEAIVNPAHISRDRQLDLCSLCHAGAVEPIGLPMRFVAGDNIRDYLKLRPASSRAPVDVHGNQMGALELSKCFTSSKMTCSTCHNVHVTQENADSFAPHCLTCHTMQACGEYRALGEKIRTKCVACHMPLQDSAKITSHEGGRALHALLRAHRIAIYPDVAASVERGMTGK
ncbi:MAG TPA: multiheme c-type cytochrome [Terracidiphilus sp.]|nr:multiheme c-type cytochrome [Terracidiphilus sp.]